MSEVADTTVQQAEAAVQQQKKYAEEHAPEAWAELIAQRNDLRKWRQEKELADKAAEETKAKEKGNYKELVVVKDAELAQLRTEREALAAKAKAYEEQQGKLRESLLGKLTDEADKIAGESIQDLDKLSRYVELRSQNKGEPFAGKGQGKPGHLDIGSLGKNYGEIEAELRRRGLA